MRSLLARTLALVVGVVLLLGAGLVMWITAEDREAARQASVRQQGAAEADAQALARELVGTSGEAAGALVEGAARRLVRWLEEEPLGLYRDPRDPSRIDVEAIKRALAAEVRRRGRAETEHVGLLLARLGVEAGRRIEAASRAARLAAEARAEAETAGRSARLALQLALLLVGMALLLAVVLAVTVVRPVQRLRAEVDRIAAGDLARPVQPDVGGAGELRDLRRDLERMRAQIAAATTGLEQEVARKTEHLSMALAERTAALEALRATQDRLVQSAKMAGLGTLAGGVAHEFNNLLGGILASLENARHGTHDAGVREDLDLARRTAQRAAALVDALLGVARPGQRAMGPVDLGKVAADVLEAARPAARARGVTLERVREGQGGVQGDDGQLHQVALNLVTNALQAVRDGGRVVVRTGSAGREAWLLVDDDGPGVPGPDRARLFEPFFTTRPSGTGLGLFVSYGIVERHGGRIEVGTSPLGGARLRVVLPAGTAQPAAVA